MSNVEAGIGCIFLGVLGAFSLAFAIPVGLALYERGRNNSYIKEAQPIIQQVIRIYDKNGNGVLEPIEGNKMARDLGIRESIPQENLQVRLIPCTDPPLIGKDYTRVDLEISARRHDGFLYEERWHVPTSRLNEIIEQNN